MSRPQVSWDTAPRRVQYRFVPDVGTVSGPDSDGVLECGPLCLLGVLADDWENREDQRRFWISQMLGMCAARLSGGALKPIYC